MDGVKLLESVACFAIYNLLASYLSADLGCSDTQAGTIAGTWLTPVSVFMFMAGFAADSLGIRRSLLVSITSWLAGRLLLTASSSRAASLPGPLAIWLLRGVIQPKKKLAAA